MRAEWMGVAELGKCACGREGEERVRVSVEEGRCAGGGGWRRKDRIGRLSVLLEGIKGFKGLNGLILGKVVTDSKRWKCGCEMRERTRTRMWKRGMFVCV